jgi:DNA-binding NarL/FixJ family response regulator
MSDPRPTVAVLADDLIWASRLSAAVERAGGLVVRDGGDVAIVDLGGRTYDGVDAVARLAPDRPVIAVAAHVDVALRKRALAAGARRVYAYSKLFSDGPGVVRELLARRR